MKPHKRILPKGEEYLSPEFHVIMLLAEASLCQLSGDVDGVPEEDWGTI